MKAFCTAALMAGLASASVDYSQKVLGFSADSQREETLEKLRNAAHLLTGHTDDATLRMTAQVASGEEIDLWTKILEMDPQALDSDRILTPGKKANKRPDSFWDQILHGEDVSKLTVRTQAGHDVPEIGGDLSAYSLRSKSVDPSSLGIDKVKQYSGYLDDNENDKHLFYWFFESRNDPKNDPVILWLNGGPGCSSMTGLFMELGPSMVKKGPEMVHNPHAWNNNASVIFLDQPVNTGFSYSGSSVSNTVAAGKDVYALLSLFFKQFPEYAKQDFHIAGESYAGHYIPVFASEILSHENRNINLKSLLIGNGLTDPLAQYPHYEPMACGDGGWPAVLEKAECGKMDEALPRCLSLIESCYNSESVWTCVPASIYCNNAMIGPYQRTGQNVYDIRGKCEADSSLCYNEIGWIGEYLNRKEVQDALGVEVSKFDGCNFDVNRNFLFQGDWMKPYHRVVPDLLAKIPVLIYAGDTDFICNWLGNRAWTDELEWAHKKEYNQAETKDLRLGDNTKYGSIKSADNLAFIRLYAAGHMVPYDQPEASLDMLNRWIGGEWQS